jgi:dynein heavy chain, axonemal
MLGKACADPPDSSISNVFANSTPTSPIIYISEAGTDAASMIQTFAASHGMLLGEKLHSISLGQGQGNAASDAIQQAMVSGHWVRTRMCYKPLS